MSLLRTMIAVEEASDGKANDELEHTLYARIVNMADLQKAVSKEHQEQWQIRVAKIEGNAGSGIIRVRKTVPNITDVDKMEYVQTTKTFHEGGVKREVPIPTTVDNFKQFQLMGDSGMLKDRYNFPVPDTDLVWEIDMFYVEGAEVGSGKYADWIKIDLEVDDLSKPLPPLPFEVTDLITNQKGKRTPEEDAIVDRLHATVFSTKNVFL